MSDKPTIEYLTAKYGRPDGFGDGDGPTNLEKVAWAHSALSGYRDQVAPGALLLLSEEWEDADAEWVLSDLVADLLHLATHQGIDADYVIDRAMLHFTAEAGRGYEA